MQREGGKATPVVALKKKTIILTPRALEVSNKAASVANNKRDQRAGKTGRDREETAVASQEDSAVERKADIGVVAEDGGDKGLDIES